MDAAAIEETNRMRVSIGLKPLPVPGVAPTQDQNAAVSNDPDDDDATLEAREAKAYTNYRKVQEDEVAKRKREEKATSIKKARDAAKRFATLEGKGFGEEEAGVGDADAKAWLMGQKKRQKKIQKSIKADEDLAAAKAKAVADAEYTSKDLAGIKVSHDVTSFLDSDEQVLTLKDSTIQELEDDGDELEAFAVREREKLTEKLDLKKKKLIYNPYEVDEDGGILGQYDDEVGGKGKKKLFTLNDKGTMPEISDILAAAPGAGRKGASVNIDDVLENVPSSDYLDVKVKKPKKKKAKSTRQKQVDEDDILLPTEPAPSTGDHMDVDSAAGSQRKRKLAYDEILDDEDLQASLAIQRKNALKKRKKMKPADITRRVEEDESNNNNLDREKEEAAQGGLVIDDISEFVVSLKKADEDADRRPSKPTKRTQHDESVTAMDIDLDDDEALAIKQAASEAEEAHRETSAPPDVSAIGVEEEKTINQGLGATLSLLKERGLIKDSDSTERNDSFRNQKTFLAEKKRRIDDFEEEAKRQRERDRTSGKLDRMSQREREEYARQQNNYRDQQTARIMNDLFKQGYRPQVELKYTDEYGRRLNEKEAFKHLSHQFHGKGSGKGKTDKLLKKIDDEKRREAQSMLDASQNVGMSSAAAQQLKKRKEAGVRLA